MNKIIVPKQGTKRKRQYDEISLLVGKKTLQEVKAENVQGLGVGENLRESYGCRYSVLTKDGKEILVSGRNNLDHKKRLRKLSK